MGSNSTGALADRNPFHGRSRSSGHPTALRELSPAEPGLAGMIANMFGDGPGVVISSTPGSKSPLHLRGWSVERGLDDAEPVVGPAPAGMVPWAPRSGPCLRSRPRARGDGPIESTDQDSTTWSPRACGDGPNGGQEDPVVYQSPRARGGGLDLEDFLVGQSVLPPRLRGWSGASELFPTVEVSPPGACEGGPFPMARGCHGRWSWTRAVGDSGLRSSDRHSFPPMTTRVSAAQGVSRDN